MNKSRSDHAVFLGWEQNTGFPSKRSTAGTLVALAVLFGSMGAHACSLEGGLSPESFKPLHPDSLRVAYAIDQAASELAIDRVSTKASPLAFYKVNSYLERLRKLLSPARQQISGKSEFYVLLVEHGLWTRFTRDEDGINMAVHVAKPDSAAIVVVTGDAVVRAIVDRKITLSEARDRDLFLVAKSGGQIAQGLQFIDP